MLHGQTFAIQHSGAMQRPGGQGACAVSLSS
jgi:hypothetical protein